MLNLKKIHTGSKKVNNIYGAEESQGKKIKLIPVKKNHYKDLPSSRVELEKEEPTDDSLYEQGTSLISQLKRLHSSEPEDDECVIDTNISGIPVPEERVNISERLKERDTKLELSLKSSKQKSVTFNNLTIMVQKGPLLDLAHKKIKKKASRTAVTKI